MRFDIKHFKQPRKCEKSRSKYWESTLQKTVASKKAHLTRSRMTAVQSIPRGAVTANDYGPAVSVITWILLVSVLGVFIKGWIGR